MIPPKLQWAVQVSVTSNCWPKDEKTGQLTGCSNCTRLLAHERKRYIMSPDDAQLCVRVAKDFVYRSPPCPQGRINKVVGMFGGEPLLTPHFPEYVDIWCNEIPEPWHRGLWTSLDWMTYESPKWGLAKPHVERLLGIADGRKRGFLNWNMHEEGNLCEHHPNLLAIDDVVADKVRMWELINNCWLNRDWSAAYAYDAHNQPKFYWCEIAASFDRVFDLGIGMAVEPGVWEHDLWLERNEQGILQPCGPYANQILSTCRRCGQALPMQHGRRDFDYKDDISKTNMDALVQIGTSPMLKRGDFEVYDEAKIEAYNEQAQRNGYKPGQYIKQGVVRSSTVQFAKDGPTANDRRRVKKVIRKVVVKRRRK